MIKGATETIEKETKKQNRGSLAMLLGTFVASLLENVSWGKGIIRASEGTIKARQDF